MRTILVLAVLLWTARATAACSAVHTPEPGAPPSDLLMVLGGCEDTTIEVRGGSRDVQLVSLGGGLMAVLRGSARDGELVLLPVRVCDAAGNCDESYLSIQIPPQDRIAISSVTLPDARVGEPYEARVESRGLPAWFAVAPDHALPAGLQLAPDGSITGVPLGPAGVGPFLVEARELRDPAARAPLAIDVLPAADGSAAPPAPAACAAVPATGCSAGGGPTSLAWLALLAWFARRG